VAEYECENCGIEVDEEIASDEMKKRQLCFSCLMAEISNTFDEARRRRLNNEN